MIVSICIKFHEYFNILIISWWKGKKCEKCYYIFANLFKNIVFYQRYVTFSINLTMYLTAFHDIHVKSLSLIVYLVWRIRDTLQHFLFLSVAKLKRDLNKMRMTNTKQLQTVVTLSTSFEWSPSIRKTRTWRVWLNFLFCYLFKFM